MATLHFPGVQESANRIERMRGTSQGIYTVGEPGLDNFTHLKLWNRNKIAEKQRIQLMQFEKAKTGLVLKRNIENNANNAAKR